MKRAAIAALFLIGGLAAAQAQEDPPADCANPQTQADMNQCAYEDFGKADDELNAVYKKAVASQAAIDKDLAENSPELVGAVKALKKAQRAWIDYRDGHCEGVSYEAAGGTMQPLLDAGCKTELTKSRTKQLKELIAGMGN